MQVYEKKGFFGKASSSVTKFHDRQTESNKKKIQFNLLKLQQEQNRKFKEEQETQSKQKPLNKPHSLKLANPRQNNHEKHYNLFPPIQQPHIQDNHPINQERIKTQPDKVSQDIVPKQLRFHTPHKRNESRYIFSKQLHSQRQRMQEYEARDIQQLKMLNQQLQSISTISKSQFQQDAFEISRRLKIREVGYFRKRIFSMKDGYERF